MSDLRINFRCPSAKYKRRVMNFLKEFSGGTATAGFFRLVQIAMVQDKFTTTLEKRVREEVLRQLCPEKKDGGE